MGDAPSPERATPGDAPSPERLSRLSLAALLMPAVWGPAHGIWASVFFYPLWLIADTCFVNAVRHGGITIFLSAVVFVGTALVTVLFSWSANRIAYQRAAGRVTLERYLRRERKWAVACALIAVVLIVVATWYNLAVRMPSLALGA
ncbi:MAG: hypothetical protein LBD25_03250 [Coriobacteriales bacterium]|jgi:hypothetical protein|nr:hypothetical protein [Coriobacteriales bacterium]